MQVMTTIAKILGLSGLISLAIKYVAPRLTIPASDGLALAMVLVPPLLVAVWLFLSRPSDSLNKSE